MADLNFNQLEAVVRETIDPFIKQQFQQQATMFSPFSFSSGNANSIGVNQRGFRIPVYIDPSDPHPWTGEGGFEAYTRLMRGEFELPHRPQACSVCSEALDTQMMALGIGRGYFRKGCNSTNLRVRKKARKLWYDPRPMVQRMLVKKIKQSMLPEREWREAA
jgi:hypothetical protein